MAMSAKYKTMLRRMQAKSKIKTTSVFGEWFLYILRCNDGSLYTGITKDIERRLKMHNTGKASHYTRTRLPVNLLYQEPCANRVEALVRECAVKSLPKRKKEELIAKQNFERIRISENQ